MPTYILDANHVGLAVNSASPVGERVFQARLAGIRLGTCLPVLCEVEAGILQVKRKAKYRSDLNHLLLQLRLWPLDLKTTQIYGAVYSELRRRGRVLSQVDVMLSALARQLKLTILTTDRDFEALPDIRTEDWSKP
jgi:tRNA(fMet)-specific endonuclease VapC